MGLMMLHRNDFHIPCPRQTPAQGKRRAVRMGVHGNHLRHSTQRAPQRLHRPFKRVQGSRAVKIAQMLAHDGHAVLQPANGILQPGAQRKNVGSFCRRAPHGPRSIPAGTAHHHGPSVHDADHGIIHGPHDRTVMHKKHIRHMAQFLQAFLHGNAQGLPAQIAAGHHQGLSPYIHQQGMKGGGRKHHPHKTAEHAHGRSQVHILPSGSQYDGGRRRSQQALLLLRQTAQLPRRVHIRHHHGKGLGIPLLQPAETPDGGFRRSVRQQLKAAHAQQSHDQAVRQHPRHLFRGSVKPVAEPQFGTV